MRGDLRDRETHIGGQTSVSWFHVNRHAELDSIALVSFLPQPLFVGAYFF